MLTARRDSDPGAGAGGDHLLASGVRPVVSARGRERECLRPPEFDLFTEQPPGVGRRYKKRLFSRLLGRVHIAFMDCTDRIYHFTHSTDQSLTEGARDSLASGRQGA